MKFDFEKTFDILCHMKDNPEGADYKFNDELTLSPTDQKKVVGVALQAFVHTVAKESDSAVIQAFSGSADLPQLTKDVFNVTMQTPNFDLGWQQAFRGVKLMKGQLSWEIATVSDPAEFVLTPEGAKCKLGSVSGEKVTAGIQKYSKGLGLTWELMEGRKLYEFVEALTNMRDKLYSLWAAIHYGLLAVAGAVNPVTWQGVATDTNLVRDIATINEGAYQIADATKDSGYGNTAEAQLILYINPKYKARINAAINSVLPNTVNSGNEADVINWNVKVIYTFNSQIPADKGILVLPGNKIQNSVYLQEAAFSQTNIETLSKEATYWTAFGAIVADNNQCAELSFT